MSRWMRKRFPVTYKIYQEIIGELYYEIMGLGCFMRCLSGWRLRRLETERSNPIEIAMSFQGIGLYRSIRPFQVYSEITALFEMIKDRKPSVVGEIGSDMGGTLYIWSRILPRDGTIVSIDLPRLYRKSLNRFFASFFTGSQEVHFVREDSHSPRCFERVKALLKGRAFDFLFIDGDHSYEGVKKDFFAFSPLVRQGGLIVFHDIAKHNLPESACGVDRFWSEVKTCYPYLEIIEDIHQEGAGIGVLFNERTDTDERKREWGAALATTGGGGRKTAERIR